MSLEQVHRYISSFFVGAVNLSTNAQQQRRNANTSASTTTTGGGWACLYHPETAVGFTDANNTILPEAVEALLFSVAFSNPDIFVIEGVVPKNFKIKDRKAVFSSSSLSSTTTAVAGTNNIPDSTSTTNSASYSKNTRSMLLQHQQQQTKTTKPNGKKQSGKRRQREEDDDEVILYDDDDDTSSSDSSTTSSDDDESSDEEYDEQGELIVKKKKKNNKKKKDQRTSDNSKKKSEKTKTKQKRKPKPKSLAEIKKSMKEQQEREQQQQQDVPPPSTTRTTSTTARTNKRTAQQQQQQASLAISAALLDQHDPVCRLIDRHSDFNDPLSSADFCGLSVCDFIERVRNMSLVEGRFRVAWGERAFVLRSANANTPLPDDNYIRLLAKEAHRRLDSLLRGNLLRAQQTYGALAPENLDPQIVAKITTPDLSTTTSSNNSSLLASANSSAASSLQPSQLSQQQQPMLSQQARLLLLQQKRKSKMPSDSPFNTPQEEKEFGAFPFYIPPKRVAAKPSEAIAVVQDFVNRYGGSQISDPVEAAKILTGAIFPTGASASSNPNVSSSSKQMILEAWMKCPYFGMLFDADFDWVKLACESLLKDAKTTMMKK